LIKDVQRSNSLGSLSAKYESGTRGPGTVNKYTKLGKGDPGGPSYGTYQIATGTGTMKNFMKWMGGHHQDMSSRFKGLAPGTESFDRAWKKLAKEKVNSYILNVAISESNIFEAGRVQKRPA
jgi:hypothetical protein